MRSSAILAPLLVLSFATRSNGAYQDEDDVGVSSVSTMVEGSTRAKLPAANERGRFSARPELIELSPDPPSSDLAQIPAGLLDPRFGKFQIGSTGRFDIVLSRSSAASRRHDRLLFDANGNRRLDDDPAPVAGVTVHDDRRDMDYTEFTAVNVVLRYNNDVTATFTFTFYYWSRGDDSPDRILAVSRSYREGEVTVEETPCRIFLYDENNDGLYGVDDVAWRLEPVADSQQSPPWSREFLPGEAPFKVRNIPYVLKEVFPDGSRFVLSSLTEAQFDVADRDAHPLTVEPDRSRAAAPIEWMTDFAAALALAKKESRPLLLLGQVDWNEAARDFATRTLADEQVVRRMKEFVCVKIDLDRAPEIRDKYQIEGSPTVLLLDSNGVLHERLVGYRSARDFCEELLRGH